MEMPSRGRSCAWKCALYIKHLKAYKPSIWGEQSTLNVKQDISDVENMTSEELAAKIAELEHKDRVVNGDRRSQAA